MKKRVNINLIIEDGKVVDFEILENGSRTEFVLDEVDEPIDKKETLDIIKEELERLL